MSATRSLSWVSNVVREWLADKVNRLAERIAPKDWRDS